MAIDYESDYDEDSDVLLIHKEGSKVKESLEVSPELIVDLDNKKNLVGLELLDAYDFLHGLNEKISKEMLLNIQNVELKIKNVRNYHIIILVLRYNNEVIEEKLPAFVDVNYKSPLLASVAT